MDTPATILNVNDDSAGRYALSRMLRSAGFEVVEASSGAEALDRVQARPDLVLLDVRLPDLNGLEVARQIKSSRATRDVLVVCLSAAAVSAEDRARGLELGADGYLAQPVEPPELIANLRALLRLKREATRAVQARDDFVSVAAHELRTPLSALKLYIQSLLRAAERVPDGTLTREKVHRSLGAADHQLDRLAALIDRLLDVSRLAEGRLALELEPVDLTIVLRELVARFEPQARAEGTHLSLELPASLVAEVDRLRVEQVVNNLVSNALKYGSGKPVQVRLEQRGDRALIAVRDRGIGIAPEDQGRIFDRFERATDRQRRESLGLGLYIVRQLVLAHGGEIRVDSQPNEGATFEVLLPLHQGDRRRAW